MNHKPEQAPPSDSNHFAYFDVIRFIAAALVMVSHARDLLLVDFGDVAAHGIAVKAFYFLTGLGHEAVVVFFVLSGFWISSSIDRRQSSPQLWTNYGIDRMARLYVVLVPALIATLCWDLAGIHALRSPLYDGTFGPNSLRMNVAHELGISQFLGNLVFLQTIAVSTFGSNGPLWSLANEFWYYIAYPGLFLLFTRRKLSPALLAVGLVAWFPALAIGFVVWLMGVGLHYASRGMDTRPVRMGAALLGGGTAALVGALALSRSGKVPHELADLVTGVCFTSLLGLIIRIKPRFITALSPLADFGAKASFTLYLAHYPFVAFLAALALGAARMQPDDHALAILGGVIVAALAYSLAFARLSEHYTGNLRRWLRARLIRA